MVEFKDSKDTSVLTVIVEDTASLLGIIIAGTAVYLSDITGDTAYDAIGSFNWDSIDGFCILSG